MKYSKITGVPDFIEDSYHPKKSKYCILIPIINEGDRILNQLARAKNHNVHTLCDIIICDGGSTDRSTEKENLEPLGVNSLLVKTGAGKQGAQLRMGLWWALNRGYEGFITIDGNDKDSIEDVFKFVEKLDEGYDIIQGSRFIKGGIAENTPISRYLAVRFMHAPIISLTARHWFTDTTNAYRGYSKKYISDSKVDVFRHLFSGYELLAYLSVRAGQLGLRCCEVAVRRSYPKGEATPTKIKGFKGNSNLMSILIKNLFGVYTPKKGG